MITLATSILVVGVIIMILGLTLPALILSSRISRQEETIDKEAPVRYGGTNTTTTPEK